MTEFIIKLLGLPPLSSVHGKDVDWLIFLVHLLMGCKGWVNIHGTLRPMNGATGDDYAFELVRLFADEIIDHDTTNIFTGGVKMRGVDYYSIFSGQSLWFTPRNCTQVRKAVRGDMSTKFIAALIAFRAKSAPVDIMAFREASCSLEDVSDPTHLRDANAEAAGTSDESEL